MTKRNSQSYRPSIQSTALEGDSSSTSYCPEYAPQVPHQPMAIMVLGVSWTPEHGSTASFEYTMYVYHREYITLQSSTVIRTDHIDDLSCFRPSPAAIHQQ